MPPRWFNSAKFGQDCTNIPSENQDIIKDFKETFLRKLDDFTFSSTGPIIEEVISEDEQENFIENFELSFERSPVKPPSPAPRAEAPSPVPQAETPSPVPQAETPSPAPRAEAPSPVPHAETPSLVPQAKTPSPAPRAEAPSPVPHAEAPSPVPHAEVPSPAPWAEAPSPVPQAETPSPVPQAEAPSPAPRAEAPSPVPRAEALGPRRSQRHRRKPLDFARGERVVYDINKSIVGYEKGFPEKYDYGRRVQSSKNRKTTTQIPPGCTTIEPVAFKVAKKGGYRFLCRQMGRRIDGAILLGPKKSKPEAKTTPNQHYGFFVTKGQILLKYSNSKGTETIYIDENHGFWVYLPPGSRYTLKNCGSSESMIAYCVIESPAD